MKKVEIITRPFHLDEIKDVLSNAGVDEVIASDIRVSGGHSNSETYLQEDYFVEFMPKIKVEFYTEKNKLADLVSTVKDIAEAQGDGATNIYVYDVEKAL